MKKKFKNLLIPATGLVILPIVGCNTVQQPEEKEATLEIVSDIKDINVAQEDGHTSEPIKTKCIGPDQKEKQINVQFELKMKGNDTLPNWICMTDKNEIQLTGGKEIGTYTFTLSAFNEKEKLYSNVKTFTVNVFEQRHIVPDKLTVSIDDNPYYMYGVENHIPIKVTPSKEGVKEQYLKNEVTCSIKMIAGKLKDLKGNMLFTLGNEGQNFFMIISKETNNTYRGDYLMRIEVALVADPSITATVDVEVHIDNLYQYRSSSCTFTRTSKEESWTLSAIDDNTTILHNIPAYIQGKKVEFVAENVASNVTLGQVILPDTVSEIGESAFYNQASLSSIEMPGVKKVGKKAFAGASIMQYRTGAIYPKLEYVEDNAFEGCSLFKIDELNDIVKIGANAFINAGFSRLTIGEKCQSLGTNCFGGCTSLTAFKILATTPPQNGGAIFDRDDALKVIKVPKESIEDYKANSNWLAESKRFEGI